MWIRDFEPEFKSQSNEWRATGSPEPKKILMSSIKGEAMNVLPRCRGSEIIIVM